MMTDAAGISPGGGCNFRARRERASWCCWWCRCPHGRPHLRESIAARARPRSIAAAPQRAPPPHRVLYVQWHGREFSRAEGFSFGPGSPFDEGSISFLQRVCSIRRRTRCLVGTQFLVICQDKPLNLVWEYCFFFCFEKWQLANSKSIHESCGALC